MALWLFKVEAACYGFADLERDGSTTWDGVSNALALKHLRAAKPGDRVLYYHTGSEKAVVGEARVTAAADGVVTIAPVKRWPTPVPLAAIKADEHLQSWELVRLPRLSVLPVTAAQWKRVEQLAKSGA